MRHKIAIPQELYERVDSAWRVSPDTGDPRMALDEWLDCEIWGLLHEWTAAWTHPFDVTEDLNVVHVSPEVEYTLRGIAIAESRSFEDICAAITVQVLNRSPGATELAPA